jgi:hypothetical protein
MVCPPILFDNDSQQHTAASPNLGLEDAPSFARRYDLLRIPHNGDNGRLPDSAKAHFIDRMCSKTNAFRVHLRLQIVSPFNCPF